MAKISQIKLTNTTYDIDVASNLKATKLIGEDPTKIPPVEAIQKPDGVNPLFDENNKISSHYVSDTILGQLKFGGTLTATDSVGVRYYNITESAAFRDRALEISPHAESYSEPYFYVDTVTGITPLAYWDGVGTSPLFGNDLAALEGFYFIMTSNTSAMINEVPLEFVPEFKVGDWWVFCNGVVKKIDNTDTITHIDETAGTSLLEITGSSGLKLKDITYSTDGSAITLHKFLNAAANLYAPSIEALYNISVSDGSMSAPNIHASEEITAASISAATKMTAPTISDKTDKSQVVNLEYFENNATKVDWENIDSEVHVINDHSVEVDGDLTVHGDSTIDGNLEITGDLSFGADSHLVFGTIEGTDFIADHAKVASDPVEDTDVVNKAYLEAYIASLGGVGGSYPAAEDIAF